MQNKHKHNQSWDTCILSAKEVVKQVAQDSRHVGIITWDNSPQSPGQDEEGVWNSFRLWDGASNGCQNPKQGPHLLGVTNTPVHDVPWMTIVHVVWSADTSDILWQLPGIAAELQLPYQHVANEMLSLHNQHRCSCQWLHKNQTAKWIGWSVAIWTHTHRVFCEKARSL